MSLSLAHKSFYFLRHGQTDWNLQRKWQGSKDIPLNETGLSQAEAVRPLVEELDIQTVCTSPLQRAHKTAEIVTRNFDLPLRVVHDLHEVSFGPFEGSDHHENPWYMDWRQGLKVDGVEDYEGFIARALGGINEALLNDGPVLVVAHGGVFWSIREHARLDPEFGAWNCALLRLDPPDDDHAFWRLEALNSRD